MPQPQTTKPAQRRRRGGRPPLAAAERRTLRLALDLAPAELAEVKSMAAAAAMPTRAWARARLLNRNAPSQAHSSDLREIWRASSTLQSNFNQLMERLNELHVAGQLQAHPAAPMLLEMHRYMPSMYQLIKSLRIDLMRQK